MILGLFLASYWWLIIPGILLGLYAQMKLSSTYAKYVRIGNARGLSGAEAAREILDSVGLHNMPVNEVGGHLTDHYDPTKKALFLSSENFRGTSLAAVGVAAHEAGHALQHQAASLQHDEPASEPCSPMLATHSWQEPRFVSTPPCRRHP